MDNNAPPTLTQQNPGNPMPGMTGGLPRQQGLSAPNNPMPSAFDSQSQPGQSHPYPSPPPAGAAAQQMQQYGRGEDSVLVHMTPNEVNSLRGLAQQFGGDLTQNPHTGLPEAGWLGKLLPTILGGIGMAFGIPPVWMGALGAVGGTAITGDLKQGLMAGLGAFGGASMAGGLGLGGAISKNALGLVGTSANPVVSGVAANVDKLGAVGKEVGTSVAKTAGGLGVPATNNIAGQIAKTEVAKQVANQAAGQAAKTGLAGISQNFASAAKTGLGTGLASKAAVPLAVAGSMQALNAFAPSGVKDSQTGAIDNSYQGPYYEEPRKATFAPSTNDLLSSSKERRYFDVAMPATYNAQGQMVQAGSNTAPGTQIWQPVLNPKAKKGENMYTFSPTTWKPDQVQDGYAQGGGVRMDQGAFVMPARETAEFGKGSTEAGQRALAQLGGVPIHGPGTGVSDSIPARIGGSVDARVANGEVLFQKDAVARIGGGDHKRGTQKLYAMMRRAEQSRKSAARGGNGLDLLKGMS